MPPFKKPRAPYPFCWDCSKKLYAGGRAFDVVYVGGAPVIVHRACAREMLEQGRAESKKEG